MKKFTMFLMLMAILLALSPQKSLAQPYTDNFESYTLGGYVAVQNPTWWTTWSNQPGSGEDGQISNAYASSGTQSVLLDEVPGPSDLVFKAGNKTSGVWEVNFKMYVETGKAGYYNILHSLPSAGANWAYEVYFKNDGTGHLLAGSSTPVNFTYPKNTWFQVVNHIDINADVAKLYVNGVLVYTWPFHYTSNSQSGGNTTLAGSDIYAGAEAGDTPLFYIDDFSFDVPAPSPGSCTYSIALWDSFGDGWNGCSIDVIVNGVTRLDNITLASGYGPATYTFPANVGEMITTTFQLGSWGCEPYYYIYDSEGNQVWYVPAGYNGCNPIVFAGQLYGTCPIFGDVEGYVFNYDGLAIAGATVAEEGGPSTTTGPNGYYLLQGVTAGQTPLSAGKAGYNITTDIVTVVLNGLVQHNFTLTQPNMVINPLYIEETLNPGEFFTTSMNVLNNGNGPLGWEAVINYPPPPTANAGGNYVINPPGYQTEKVEPNGPASIGYGASFDEGSRDLMLCPDPSLFSIPPVGSNNGYTSTASAGYKCYQSFSGVEGPISVVNFWGIFAGYTLPTTPGNFLIELCQPGSSPGAVVTSITVPLVGVNTGQVVVGSYQVGFFTTEIPATDLPAGWLSVQFQSSPIFYWVNTMAGAGFPAMQNTVPLPERLAMCLGGGGGASNWLTMDYYDGTVPPFGGVDNIPTHLDAAGTEAGQVYTADIVFTSTPFVGEITVPVTMIIMGPPLVAPENLTVTLINDITGEVGLTWEWAGDAFQFFMIKRDGVIVGTTTNLSYTDILPTYGEFCYTVQAVYDEGQTSPAGPECVEWPNPIISVNPTSLEGWVWVDHQVKVYTTISNIGIGSLYYEFPAYMPDASEDSRAYCSASGGCDEHISRVQMGTIDNSSYCSGYADYTYLSTTVESGETYPITVTNGVLYYSTDQCGIWVDWNNDENFENDGTITVNGSPGVGPYTADITVPDNVAGGPTRMRIRICYSSTPAPCGGSTYGEVEDYTLNVVRNFVVSVEPPSGVIPSGESRQIELTYDATGFEVGTYFKAIELTSNDPNNGSMLINNTMHVYMPGEFAGMVYDRDDNSPISGATVTAGPFQTTTSEDGTYSLFVDQGSYDVVFQKLGYMPVTVSDTFALQGVITPLSVGMWDENYPPGFVHAEVMANDTWCEVTWSLPQGPYEIVMDDGEADDYFIWSSIGNMDAVKFTPAGYPATAIGGQIYVGDGSFPGPFLGTQFGIAIFDDDGPNGLPGTMLDTNGVTVNNYGWVSFDWLNATITDGSFYLAMIQTAPSPFAAPIGVDLDNPTYFKSYILMAGAPSWVLSPLQDFMIRAWVSGPESDAMAESAAPQVWRATPKIPSNWQQYGMTKSGTLPKILPSYERNDVAYRGVQGMEDRNVTNYRVARYSNFDPNGSPAAGTLSELASTGNLYYNDNAWAGLPMGWYAYGVKALYTSGLYSNYTISNIVGHLMDYQVTVNVTLSTGLEPINVEVTLQGLEYPYSTLFAVTPANGTVVFDPVWRGHYNISAFKIGYDTYTINNTFINADKVYNIVLSEKKYPPTCLVVDPVSLIATWCEPLRTAIDENFENSLFPPTGWQVLTQGDASGWERTDDGSSSNWPIPSWDSFYAMSNDDAAGSDNDGCCDYLITPAVDLRESEGYALSFNSFYDGAFGELAFVEYSVDGGATWEVLSQMTPATNWADIELDLSAFSGLAGPSQVWFAFHADDAGAYASGWAVDNVKIQVPAPAASYLDFWVFLDDAFEGVTTETTWNYAPILYGTNHTASVAARYTSGLSAKDYYSFFCKYLFPPDSLTGYAPDDAAILQWYPPWEYWPPVASSVSDGPKYSNPPAEFIAGAVSDELGFNRTGAIDQVTGGGSRDVGDVILSFPAPSPIGLCWGIADDGQNLWITDPNISATNIYQVTYDGTNTGTVITVSLGQSWVGDMVSDGTFLYGCLVGGPNTIVKVDLETGETVEQITGAWTVTSQRGLGADFVNEEYYIGGWNSNQIWRVDATGATISTFGFSGVSGLAWHPTGGTGDGSLWIMVNAGSDLCTEVDPNNSWGTLQSFVMPDDQGYSGAGAEIKRSMPDGGALWLCNQSNNTVYLVDLAEPWSPGPGGGDMPDNILGYNVYRDGDFVAYTPQTPPEEFVPQHYVDQGLQPGIYQYTVTGVYDLAKYGFPGETGESMEEGPAEVIVDFCYDLEFVETWSLGTFDDNNWLTDGSNWTINGQTGNPSPAAEFTWDPILTNYESSLTSYPLCATGMTEGKIWLDFDLKLNSVQPTGEELIQAQVWNWDTKVWNTVAEFSNADGSFDWASQHINIKGQAMGKVFKIRFHAMGVNSINILGWLVDNIHVYRACAAPSELTAAGHGELHGILLNWLEPEGPGIIDQWIHWDDGVNSGQSIGTGGAAEFDVAARWEPAQLVDFEGAAVTQIAYFPAEPTATYHVRVWIGAGAANLVCDQVVTPIIGQWNTATLTTPVPIDITQELWVGYYINTPAGYPAGVDDGPAIDGYGNMMNFGGWQTLLQINPDLDFNWNISAHLMTVAGVTMPLGKSTEPYHNESGMSFVTNPNPIQTYQVFAPSSNGTRELTGYNIYRSIQGEQFSLLDFTTEITYLDTDEDLTVGTVYCYMISAVWTSETDNCESAFTNEACELWDAISDPNANTGSFNLYPNPADDHVFITTSGDLKRVTVYNALGQLVMDEITTGKQYELLTTSYTIGVYMVRVETLQGTTTRTLTIQR